MPVEKFDVTGIGGGEISAVSPEPMSTLAEKTDRCSAVGIGGTLVNPVIYCCKRIISDFDPRCMHHV